MLDQGEDRIWVEVAGLAVAVLVREPEPGRGGGAFLVIRRVRGRATAPRASDRRDDTLLTFPHGESLVDGGNLGRPLHRQLLVVPQVPPLHFQLSSEAIQLPFVVRQPLRQRHGWTNVGPPANSELRARRFRRL